MLKYVYIQHHLYMRMRVYFYFNYFYCKFSKFRFVFFLGATKDLFSPDAATFPFFFVRIDLLRLVSNKIYKPAIFVIFFRVIFLLERERKVIS